MLSYLQGFPIKHFFAPSDPKIRSHSCKTCSAGRPGMGFSKGIWGWVGCPEPPPPSPSPRKRLTFLMWMVIFGRFFWLVLGVKSMKVDRQNPCSWRYLVLIRGQSLANQEIADKHVLKHSEECLTQRNQKNNEQVGILPLQELLF